MHKRVTTNAHTPHIDNPLTHILTYPLITHPLITHPLITHPLITPHTLPLGRGSGLALPLAKEILTLHGGSVSLTSEVGQGSTFGFTLPLKVMGPEGFVRVMLWLLSI